MEPKKVLVVEDDPFLVKIMKNRLKEEGLEIDVAEDGHTALDRLKKNDYALILLDLVMPVKTGFEVLQELRAIDDKTPVIVFTNLAQEEDKKEVMSLGAKAYYIKSDISIDDLVKTVKGHLE